MFEHPRHPTTIFHVNLVEAPGAGITVTANRFMSHMIIVYVTPQVMKFEPAKKIIRKS